jgi:steroid 5-alpha reductase family enzyme
MYSLSIHLSALPVILLAGVATWIISLLRRDVSIVDSLWSLMFLLAAGTYFLQAPAGAARATLVLALVAVWALRLAGHITLRNWGEGEDHRYQAIRRNNEPHFWLKSIYLVFGLQGVLAWVISLPLLAAMLAPGPLGPAALAGLLLWAAGLFFETVGDWQLARFKGDPANRGRVMDRGLWRYTRHPNYFGEFCIWWGFYLIALDAGGWWSILSPLLMTFLLLRVSGVALLERDIGERRPAYRDYVARTNAFFPGPPRSPAYQSRGETS